MERKMKRIEREKRIGKRLKMKREREREKKRTKTPW